MLTNNDAIDTLMRKRARSRYVIDNHDAEDDERESGTHKNFA